MNDEAQQPKLLYTVNEAAAGLGIGRTTLYHLMGTGQLRPVHIGRLTRFTADELDRYVNNLQTGGGSEEQRPRSA